MPRTEPKSVTADGGNKMLVEQDEQDILNRVVTSVAMTTAPGGEEQQTYVNPQFREAM